MNTQFFRQLARLDDHARGSAGRCRSEMPDSPLGRDVWFSPAARQKGSRPDDLAEGWAQLAVMRRRCLEQGGNEADFTAQALQHKQYASLFRFILKEYWNWPAGLLEPCLNPA
ncbi:MAG TPA: hypothetical protein VGO93_09015 [Candidatus Xenobia bacterium]|jgi:hypothetical protein